MIWIPIGRCWGGNIRSRGRRNDNCDIIYWKSLLSIKNNKMKVSLVFSEAVFAD